MSSRLVLASSALLMITVACRGVPSAVPLAADRTSLDAIVGVWNGEYDSPVTGRSGTIQFTIRPGVDTLYGDVVMMPKQMMRTEQPSSSGNTGGHVYPTPQPLEIRFARIAEGEVSGVMMPYTDPDCSCEVTTSFRGRVQGDRISGTFRTVGRGVETTGSWKVTRAGRT